MTKKVSIIGAGLAGLSAGIYLQREGVETQLFELAPRAGGMCAAWQRKGYIFDGGFHWMIGTKKGSAVYDLYKEVGALTDDTSIYNASFMSLEMKGAVYNVPLELEQFKSFLRTLSTRDASHIDAFCREIDIIKRSELILGPPFGVKGVLDLVKNSRGFLCIALKYKGKTVWEVVNSFKSDIIRDILLLLMPGHFSAAALFLMLGTRMSGNAGYPIGGSVVKSASIQGLTRSLLPTAGQRGFVHAITSVIPTLL
jgi:phytoene dehydrogenase-like protein